MLVIGIVLLLVSIFCLILAGMGIDFQGKEKKGENADIFLVFFLGFALQFFGALSIHHSGFISGVGKIHDASSLQNEIYKVRGQVSAINGKVVVIEDGENNVYAVWGSSDLPENTTFVTVLDNKLEPVVLDLRSEKKDKVTAKSSPQSPVGSFEK